MLETHTTRRSFTRGLILLIGAYAVDGTAQPSRLEKELDMELNLERNLCHLRLSAEEDFGATAEDLEKAQRLLETITAAARGAPERIIRTISERVGRHAYTPRNTLFMHGVRTEEFNCTGLSHLYAGAAQALSGKPYGEGFPLFLAHLRNHMLVCYAPSDQPPVYWEATQGQQVDLSWFVTQRSIPPRTIENGTYGKPIRDPLHALSFAFNDKGAYLLGRCDFPTAQKEFERALLLNPRFPEAKNNLGIALRRQGWYDEALGMFKSAIRLDWNFVEPYINGALTEWDRGRPDVGEYMATLALKKDPESMEAYRVRSEIREARCDAEGAAADREAHDALAAGRVKVRYTRIGEPLPESDPAPAPKLYVPESCERPDAPLRTHC